VKDSKNVLHDLAVSLGVLAAVLGILFLWALFSGRNNSIVSTYFNNSAAAEQALEKESENNEPKAEPQELQNQKKEEIKRYIVKRHIVVGGESFSLISGMYWDDIFLWPDLYIHNHLKSEDPDLIYPDEIIDIYNRLGHGNNFSTQEKKLILDAYIEVYNRYKSIGPEKNHSAWTLLWCAAKYDHNFLEKYSDKIDPEDKAAAQRYIDEEGFLD